MEGALVRNTSYTHFILDGFSDLGEWRPLLFIPYFLMFILAIAANSFLVYVIISSRSLHTPMCILIAALTCVDLCVPVFFVPNMLVSFAFDIRDISLEGCLVQMFCIYFVGTFQSTLLLWMALDRYFAICTPPFYHKHMAFRSFLSFIIPPVIRNILVNILMVSFAGKHKFCLNKINHCFCEHMALVQLACDDTSINSLLGLVNILSIPVLDFVFISVSYIVIIFSVFNKTGKPNPNTTNTAVTHLIVMIVHLTLAVFSAVLYRVRNNFSPSSRLFLSTMYLLFPTCFNPIIYGIRTREIRQQALKCIGFASSE